MRMSEVKIGQKVRLNEQHLTYDKISSFFEYEDTAIYEYLEDMKKLLGQDLTISMIGALMPKREMPRHVCKVAENEDWFIPTYMLVPIKTKTSKSMDVFERVSELISEIYNKLHEVLESYPLGVLTPEQSKSIKLVLECRTLLDAALAEINKASGGGDVDKG